MPIDFKYVPTSGALSGKSFEEQTERAFNELGIIIDDSNAAAAEALGVANNALSAAETALATAQTAESSANNAAAQAGAAAQAASAAGQAAGNAQARADSAYDLAAQADTAAQTAGILAGTAQQQAAQAQTTADTAQSAATTAQDTAERAMSQAEAAVGVFIVDGTEEFDANEYFGSAAKYFITGDSPANFPPEISEPFWFAVFITDDGKNVMQECHSETTDLIYTRTGTVNDSDPDHPVVTWGAWNGVVVPEVIKSVTTEENPPGQPEGVYLVIVSETSAGDVTSYFNLTQAVGAGYTAGNGAIAISADKQISLQLDPADSDGLSVGTSGLQSKKASPVQTGMVASGGLPGQVYASGNGDYAFQSPATVGEIKSGLAASSRDGAPALIDVAGALRTLMHAQGAGTTTIDIFDDKTLPPGTYLCQISTATDYPEAVPPTGVYTVLHMRPRSDSAAAEQFWFESSNPRKAYFRYHTWDSNSAWRLSPVVNFFDLMATISNLENGYVKIPGVLPDGTTGSLIVQWGRTSSADRQTTIIPWNFAFPTALLRAYATGYNVGLVQAYVSATQTPTRTQGYFNAFSAQPGASPDIAQASGVHIHWLAIGY